MSGNWKEVRLARRADREDARACREAKADPVSLEKLAALNRVRWEQIKAGRLKAYQILKGGALCR